MVIPFSGEELFPSRVRSAAHRTPCRKYSKQCAMWWSSGPFSALPVRAAVKDRRIELCVLREQLVNKVEKREIVLNILQDSGFDGRQ